MNSAWFRESGIVPAYGDSNTALAWVGDASDPSFAMIKGYNYIPDGDGISGTYWDETNVVIVADGQTVVSIPFVLVPVITLGPLVVPESIVAE